MTAQRADLLDELAGEIRHNYGRGRAVVGVDGSDPAAAARFADELAAVLGAERAAVGGRAAAEVRSDIVAPFRAGEGAAALVIDGRILDRPEVVGMCHYTVWLDGPPDAGGEGGFGTRLAATAIVDATDPDSPARRLTDWCVVPRR